MIKIRLEGLPLEVQEVAKQIGTQFSVLEQSEPYANRSRSKFVRIYMSVERKKTVDEAS